MPILDRLRRGVSTRSPGETRRLAEQLARTLPADSTLALHGDLGVGKTTFVQGLARGLGVEAPVTSPTFAIFNLLRPTAEGASTLLVHLDAYRIGSEADLEALMLDDFLVSPYCLAVEWPDRVPGVLPPGTLHLDLGIRPDGRHTIRLRR